MGQEHSGKVMTARGPIEPRELGAVLMHEHLHCDVFDWARDELITEERPMTVERRELLTNEALPPLKQCTEHGCFGFVEATAPPWRAWPTFYSEASEATNVHIVLCTGFYYEVEFGTYWVKRAEDAIWPFVVASSVEELAQFCVRDIVEGLHGTAVRAGAIKLGSDDPEMTEAERKAFLAGARAQKATGVPITTHCTGLGTETTQLSLLEREGVDLNRVIIGHTAWHLMDPECRATCIDWMKRGANFLPTNLGIGDDGGQRWQPLVDAIHDIFDQGCGDRLCLGLDWAFVSESGPFGPCNFVPPPPFLHMFTHTLPAFRERGLTAEQEQMIMRENPQRMLAIR